MPHRLVLTTERGQQIMDFELEREGRNGWAWLRVVRIEDDPPLPNRPAVQYYDPEIHNAHTVYAYHPMSQLWRARGRHQRDGALRYRLVGGWGTPGYVQLEHIH